ALILSYVGLPVSVTDDAGVNVLPELVQASPVAAPVWPVSPVGVGVPSLPQAERPSANVATAATTANLRRFTRCSLVIHLWCIHLYGGPSRGTPFPSDRRPCPSSTMDLVGQDLRQEVLGAIASGAVEELVRRRLLDELAVRHEHDAVGGVAGKTQPLGGDGHRHSGAGQPRRSLGALA